MRAIAVLFVALLFLAAPALGFRARVLRVVDGDTLWVKNLESGRRVKVRVWGIDTPEKFPSKKLYRSARRCHITPGAIKRLGRFASVFAARTLEGRVVEVIPKGKGYYGRLLGKVIIPPEVDYGELAVEEGYACVYRRDPEARFAYDKALKRAKQRGRGLWAHYDLMNCLCEN